MSALKRIRRAIDGLGPYAPVVTDRGEVLTVLDLRAVLALAEQADELKRRLIIARKTYDSVLADKGDPLATLARELKSFGEMPCSCFPFTLRRIEELRMRKPLPRAARTRRKR